MRLLSNYSNISNGLFIATYVFVGMSILFIFLEFFLKHFYLTIATTISSFTAILLTFLSIKNIENLNEDITKTFSKNTSQLNSFNINLTEDQNLKILGVNQKWSNNNSQFKYLNFCIEDGIISYNGEKIFDITKDTSLNIDFHKIELQKVDKYSFVEILYPGLTINLLFKDKNLEAYKSENSLSLTPSESFCWNSKKINELGFNDNSKEAVFNFQQL